MLSMRHAAETAQLTLSAVMHALMQLCSYGVMHARVPTVHRHFSNPLRYVAMQYSGLQDARTMIFFETAK